MSLVIVSTHPIQYHAPVYRRLHEKYGIDVTVIYGSDSSISGYRDKDFSTSFAWDTNLLSGYQSVFLNHAAADAGFEPSKLSCHGLAAAIDRARPTAVLLLGYATPIYQKAWLRARFKRYPIFFRMETYDELYRGFVLKNWLRAVLLREVYRRTNAFLYIGKASHRHYERLKVSEQKLFFSPYTVDADIFDRDESSREKLRSDQRKVLGIREEDTAIIFSGKIAVKKNPQILLRAIKTLSPAVQKKIAVIYLGDGPLKDQVENEQGPDLAARVFFCGFKNQTQLSPYYHAADFLILPSLYNETWGLVVNEALEHGLPCVVSDRVGCREDLIERGVTGDIFKAGDQDDLARAILHMMKLVPSAVVRQRCRDKVSTYSIDEAARGIARAYAAIAVSHEK